MMMIPAAWSLQKTGTGTSANMNEPQSTFNFEAQMALEARQKIQARLKVATLFQQYRARLTPTQHDVTVTSDPASVEEKICLIVQENTRIVPLTVKNSSARTLYLTLWVSDLVKKIFTVSDRYGYFNKTIKQHTLGPGEAYKIRVHFSAEHAGFYEQLLVFKFKTDPQSSDIFEIMRLLEVIHRTSFNEELLPTATNSLYTSQTVKHAPTDGVELVWLKSEVPLKKYAMADDIKYLSKSDMDLEKETLNWMNYAQRFHLLLHLEELQLKTDIEKYKQKDVHMFRHKHNPDLLVLQIAEVASNSPLKLSGNQVLVTPLEQLGVLGKKVYKGWVQHVETKWVYLQFSDEFLSQFKDSMRFNVTFVINRTPLCVQHRAAALVYKHKLREVLFPTGQLSSHHSQLHRLLALKNNPEQCKAIQHIVAGTAKPAPYLLFGPPGTGKTETLVEAIKQLIKTQPSCTILACAPSNSATDHLCEKILEGTIDNHKLYRLYALHYPVGKIPQNLKLWCNLDRLTNKLMIPPKVKLMKYKIMVTTLLTAGRLVTGGIPPGHYTYIFVDEAGQAAETECIIPIAGLLKPETCQLVLAGDPKQLGPIITSRMAKRHGMGVSLLERLMRDISLYKSHEVHGFNNRFVTKLLRNYRSHPEILKIPNELFYKGELQPYAQKEKCCSYCQWEHLPKKDFPLIFHGVAGINERDANSPSVYNLAEVEVLKEYLKSILDHLHKKGVTKIQSGEIGIISPYRKQVEKIQYALQMDKDLRKENLENIPVGSVEQFQGKEFNVILVSTARSNPKLTAHKERFTLGFVSNEKRFNVAMTRAQALLIVVGDPRALKTDNIWNKFIYYCLRKGAYRGITVSEEEDALTKIH
ncbi:putative helicase mov-10-B.1 isoform X2 [Trachinotus anak]|uniref:putative helicase mov-10-B.1 isoform X2 n=1 Tax=Trachinotus anak TaxID=443729 RepID=UPI0039F24D6B